MVVCPGGPGEPASHPDPRQTPEPPEPPLHPPIKVDGLYHEYQYKQW